MKNIHGILTSAILLLLLLCPLFALSAQEGESTGSAVEAAQHSRIQRAEVSPLYRVTPGDEYLLHIGNQNNTQLSLTVESDYSLRLAFLGTIDARGLSYAELREQVYAMVKEGYPQSIPSLRIRNLGMFEISYSGELKRSGTALADGLTPLSDVLSSLFTSFSDTRNISITRNDGTQITVDYFQFSRSGDRQHNPYLHYGDRITVSRSSRIAQVDGQVFRPGRYRLTEEDSLEQVLQYYADGLRHNADTKQIYIYYQDRPTEVVDLSNEAALDSIRVEHLSRIFVPSMEPDENSLHIASTSSTENSDWIQVTGDVIEPGKYPMSSWNKAEYYINQAGPQGRYRYSIYSSSGEKKAGNAPLAPMDTIVVQERPVQRFMNSWLAPTVSLATGILTLISMILNF